MYSKSLVFIDFVIYLGDIGIEFVYLFNSFLSVWDFINLFLLCKHEVIPDMYWSKLSSFSVDSTTILSLILYLINSDYYKKLYAKLIDLFYSDESLFN